MSFIARSLIVVIRLYQKLVSPRLNRQCLFRPTCSEYTIQQLQQHGLSGLRSAYIQMRDCRDGFTIHVNGDGRLEMTTRTGRVVPEDRIAQHIVLQYKEFLHSLDNDQQTAELSPIRNP